MATPLNWVSAGLRELSAAGLLRVRRSVHCLPGGWCEVDGRRLRNFAGNDYLDLAGDARVLAAARQALAADGAGARASPLICGRTAWHVQLEQRLAAFEGTDDALLFPTGYAANVGTITALAGEGDLVLSDRLNHASLIDGCKLSGAAVRVYPHREAGRVDHELRKHRAHRRRLIVTDAAFSMDGDLAPLPDLCDVARRHEALVVVDEAHGTGVHGAHGRGVSELLGVEADVVRVGTLSKALGSQGGFVTGPRELIDWLWNRARTQMFSTALAPAACAAASAAIDVVVHEPERRIALQQRGDELRALLAERGVAVAEGSCGPIVPVIVGEAERVVRAGAELEARGFLVGVIRPPTVPQGSSRFRISLSAAHQPGDVRALADAIAEILEGTLE